MAHPVWQVELLSARHGSEPPRAALTWVIVWSALALVAAAALVVVLSRVGPAAVGRSASPSAAVTASPNFASDVAANERAADAVDPLGPPLEKDPTFGGLRIIATGVEISTVGRPSAFVRDAVVQIGSRVPVQVRSVRYSVIALSAMRDRIGRDAERWRRAGIDVSGVGLDTTDNRVTIDLRHYSDAAAGQLKRAYGAMATVTPRDVDYRVS
jgi:hypothetical protein